MGRATERGGYTDGLVLRDGAAASGVGGGLCQISNMLHWLTLHSDLTVAERHRHSFDPFPDSERRVPFGTGATLLDGIFDLKVTNGTAVDHQFRLRLTDTQLVGELRAALQPSVRYEVVERDHRFVREGGEVFRDNRIVRLAYPIDADPGAGPEAQPVSEVELFANHCRVGYPVDDAQISSGAPASIDQPSRAWPMYSPGWTPAAGPRTAPSRWAWSRCSRTSDLARRSWRGTNCACGIGHEGDEDEPGVGRAVGGDAVVVVVRPAQDPLRSGLWRGPGACATVGRDHEEPVVIDGLVVRCGELGAAGQRGTIREPATDRLLLAPGVHPAPDAQVHRDASDHHAGAPFEPRRRRCAGSHPDDVGEVVAAGLRVHRAVHLAEQVAPGDAGRARCSPGGGTRTGPSGRSRTGRRR